MVKAVQIKVYNQAAETIEASASYFVDHARKSLSSRKVFRVLLAGGSTPKKLYELLADTRAPFRNQLDWSRIQWFWGDERSVAPTHVDSNFKMAYEAMLSHVPASPGQFFRIEAEGTDAELNALAYEARLRAVFGSEDLHEGFPIFDFALVS